MKVKFLPYQPHCFAFGGFEIQTLSTLAALQDCGADVSTLDVWSRDSSFDVLHCWGLGLANYENIVWAKRAGKIVLATALVPYFDSFREKMRFFISSKVYKSRLHIEMAALLDQVIVVNEQQKEVLTTYFKVPRSKISIIPNVVNKIFFNKTHTILENKFELKDYVLTTGNVCERKNQVRLAEACIKADVNLLVIGKVLHGEEDYGKKLQKLTNEHENIKWVQGLPPHSPELLAAYQNCAMFALPSYIEQQPISLLEAAALQKPLLIADKAYAHQKYYTNAKLVHPESVSSIKSGILDVMANPGAFCVPQHILQECTSEQVGNAYLKIYHSVYL